MPVQLSWYLPGRIILSSGTLEPEEIAERNRLLLALIESEGEPPFVHVLIDHTRSAYSEGDLEAHARSLSAYVKLDHEEVREKLLHHSRLGWVVSVATPTASLKMAGTISSQQRNYRWHSVDTFDEALEFLQSRDTTLPNLKHV